MGGESIATLYYYADVGPSSLGQVEYVGTWWHNPERVRRFLFFHIRINGYECLESVGKETEEV